MQEIAQGLEPGVGVVCITSAPAISTYLLAPAVKRFAQEHPAITLELLGSNTMAHMDRLEADIAIRPVKPDQGDLVTRRLLDFDLVVAGHPDLARGYDPGHFHKLPWLTWTRSMGALPEAQWLARASPDARVVMRAAQLTTIVEAARAGVGVFLTAPLFARALGLHVVDHAPPLSPRGSLWMVAHRALRRVERVDTVWRWLIAYVEELEREILLT